MNGAVRFLLLAMAVLMAACSNLPGPTPAPPPVDATAVLVPPEIVVPPVPTPVPVKIGLALGGGAARGFAHIGVIKALEAAGIVPDIVVGTSAGSIVGALYASGMAGAELQKIAYALQEAQVVDWGLPDRGLFKGEALQRFVNRAVNNRPLEKMLRLFGVVATDLNTGEASVFRTGDTGLAVRASSAVPGLFKPVKIGRHEFVDGGLTSPVPVLAARAMGADFVIAVDISAQPKDGKTVSMVDVMSQTFTIMGKSISRFETMSADVVIRPSLTSLSETDFTSRPRAIVEGEKSANAAMAAIKAKLHALRFPPLPVTTAAVP